MFAGKRSMGGNDSLPGIENLRRQVDDQVHVLQVLVGIFLCINALLIATFLRKECFYTTTRYMFFAVTLVSDSMILFMSDILVILFYFRVALPVSLCLIFCMMLYVYFFLTPVTLTAMTLERYVAICMPLRHGELCSTRNTVHCILIVHGLSSVPCIVYLSIFFASAPHTFYTQANICTVEIFVIHAWQGHLRSAIDQLYFLIMCVAIVFSYVQIMKVAKAASGENKKSTWKGLRTVALHTFQLLLCLIQLWCPFIEAAVLQIDFILFIQFRFFNYVMFSLVPRFLSPLVYGLRDEKFFHELKTLTSFCLYTPRRK